MQILNADQVRKAKASWELEEYVISHQINYPSHIDEIREGSVVILGLHEKMGEQVRQKLYGFGQSEAHIVDLGNVLRNDVNEVIQLLHDLWDRGGLVVMLSDHMNDTLFHHIHSQYDQPVKNTACISRSSKDLFRLYPQTEFVSIAHQSHRGRPEHLFKSQNNHWLRLGELRSYFAESEPYLRDAQVCCFDLNSVRFSDSPAQSNPSSSGLTSEEACHLAVYAGQAQRNRMLWISNYHYDLDQRQITADLISQLIWYYASGVQERKDPYPLQEERMISYLVEFHDLDVPLKFLKSPRTDRWWVVNTYDTKARPVPCSLRDYEWAKNGELSPRLLQLLEVYS